VQGKTQLARRWDCAGDRRALGSQAVAPQPRVKTAGGTADERV
jgi:hypothetical protein